MKNYHGVVGLRVMLALLIAFAATQSHLIEAVSVVHKLSGSMPPLETLKGIFSPQITFLPLMVR